MTQRPSTDNPQEEREREKESGAEREIERETGGVLFMWPSEQLNWSEPRRAGNVGK